MVMGDKAVTKPLFSKRQVRTELLYRDIGQKPERPFTILGLTLETTLGDLVAKFVYYATVKSQFTHAKLHVHFRDVRPYSRKIALLTPQIDRAETLRGELPGWIRSFLKRDRYWRPLFLDFRKGRKRPFYDMIIPDWMADVRSVHALPNVVPLKVPPESECKHEQALITAGLDRTRWFAVLHWRESNYKWRARVGGVRNSDPDAFSHLIDYVINDLGGQVVLLGHPEMSPVASRSGLVDLRQNPGGFMLQAYAVSKARFMVAGPSGVAPMGFGFQIPTAIVDATDAQCGWGDMERFVLTQELSTPNRGLLRNTELFDAGLLSQGTLRKLTQDSSEYSIRKCTGSELAAVADRLFSSSCDTTAWRSPVTAKEVTPPNSIVWPPQTREEMSFFDV